VNSEAKTVLSGLFAAFLSVLTHAGVYNNTYSSGFASSGIVPDGNSTGWSDSRSLSGLSDFSISSVTVALNISGGYNGDLYAYLSHDGILVPLLNRAGVTSGNPFGYSDSGFNVTLSSEGANDVHFYNSFTPSFNGNGQLTGTWQPDGRNISPLSPASTFDSASRVDFSAYNGDNPNGTWTLFIADMASGDQSQLQSWSLGITAVPEPVGFALGIFAGISVVVGVYRARKRLLPRIIFDRAK
jgi:Proprotein convertase P-domain